MVSEDELQRQGFRKRKATYHGTCSFCGQTFLSGEEIFWKRDEATTICCRRCWGKNGKTVKCPSCGVEFEVYEPERHYQERELPHDEMMDETVHAPE
jgi:ribosomal protein L37E